MEILSIILLVTGLIVGFICGIWMLILQFQTSIFWGLGCLLIPFVALIWLVMYWEEGKYPFLYSLGAIGLIFAGAFFSGDISEF